MWRRKLRLLAVRRKGTPISPKREILYFWGLWTTSCCVEYMMGKAARTKNTMSQVGAITVAYATAATDAIHKIVRVPIHSHRSLSHKIRFDIVWSFSKINRTTSENGKRNGHPEMNTATRDVETKNIRPRRRRAPMAWPILAWTAKTDLLVTCVSI